METSPSGYSISYLPYYFHSTLISPQSCRTVPVHSGTRKIYEHHSRPPILNTGCPISG
jgi:hypothetical protein